MWNVTLEVFDCTRVSLFLSHLPLVLLGFCFCWFGLVSRHTFATAAPWFCVLFVLLWLGLVLVLLFVSQMSSCRLLFDLEFAGT